MAPVTQFRWFFAVVAGLLAVLLIVKRWPVDHVVNYRPECPVDSVVVQDTETRAVTSFKQLSTSGHQTLVPEFNDCQRFSDSAGTSYGPLVGIFARQSLNEQIARMYQLAYKNEEKRAVSVAEIVDFDGPGYSQLGISRQGYGFNCLYMWISIEGSDTTRNAYMQPVRAEGACNVDRSPNRLPANAHPLKVYPRTPDAALTGNDYPEVARWDWDRAAGVEYISIGCLSAWCEIGAAPLTESPRYTADPALPKAERRVLAVKGWYDEEVLAIDNGGGTLVPSHVTGTLIPDAKLGDLHINNGDFHAKWPTVARAVLSASLTKYVHKLNLQPGLVAGGPYNVIALCEGDAVACSVPKIDETACTAKSSDPWFGHPWYARIISATGDTAYRCVIRRPHDHVNIPGMVRWRWNNKDQIGWIKCDAGCCEVTGLH